MLAYKYEHDRGNTCGEHDNVPDNNGLEKHTRDRGCTNANTVNDDVGASDGNTKGYMLGDRYEPKEIGESSRTSTCQRQRSEAARATRIHNKEEGMIIILGRRSRRVESMETMSCSPPSGAIESENLHQTRAPRRGLRILHREQPS